MTAELRVPPWFWQPLRKRGRAWLPAGGAQQPATCRARPVCRAAERHGLHRTTRRQPPHLVLPNPTRRAHGAQRATRAGALEDRRPGRRVGAARSLALAPDRDSRRAARLHRRPAHRGGQRRRAGSIGPGHPPGLHHALDGATCARQRRWRDAVHPAAGPPGDHHRVRRARGGARPDCADAARHGVQGGGGRADAGVCGGELRCAVPSARAGPDRQQRPGQRARLPGAGGALRSWRDRLRGGAQVRRTPVAQHTAAIALQRGGLARQPGAAALRHAALHDHRLDQLRPPRPEHLHRAHLARATRRARPTATS